MNSPFDVLQMWVPSKIAIINRLIKRDTFWGGIYLDAGDKATQ